MSIPRTLEPEVMDSWDEAESYDRMDHAEVNRRFVDDLLAAGPVAGDVLDLGTGTALIPIELCSRVGGCRVLAADMAVAMLELAKYRIEAAGQRQRIHLAQCDAKRLPQPDGTFDLVISNSIVHHIPDPAICLSEMVRVTKPGGRLFVRDLMRPESAERVDALVALHAATADERQKRLLTESLHAALTLDEIRDLVAALGFDRASVEATSDRHWTWSAIKAS
ncbi:MAG TPA: ubiquinone biosynthesis protein UbiE [Planctomycetaceae bacterium]|nr:ubiquinone biosynthesis protein UbiE [Planctomycetaceae bacterium]HRF02606.1 class I SAM-dependent methyltransferase [Pirellulaceae bacterium]